MGPVGSLCALEASDYFQKLDSGQFRLLRLHKLTFQQRFTSRKVPLSSAVTHNDAITPCLTWNQQHQFRGALGNQSPAAAQFTVVFFVILCCSKGKVPKNAKVSIMGVFVERVFRLADQGPARCPTLDISRLNAPIQTASRDTDSYGSADEGHNKYNATLLHCCPPHLRGGP